MGFQLKALLQFIPRILFAAQQKKKPIHTYMQFTSFGQNRECIFHLSLASSKAFGIKKSFYIGTGDPLKSIYI